MRTIFFATVEAINPTATSGYKVGRDAVTLGVTPTEMGSNHFTIVPQFTHEDTRALAALFGKHNAVRVTVDAGQGLGEASGIVAAKSRLDTSRAAKRIANDEDAQLDASQYQDRRRRLNRAILATSLELEKHGCGGLSRELVEADYQANHAGNLCDLCGRRSDDVDALAEGPVACKPCRDMHTAILDEEYALPDGEHADSALECLKKMWMSWIRRPR